MKADTGCRCPSNLFTFDLWSRLVDEVASVGGMAMTMARFIFITLVLPIVIQASMRDIKGPYSREGDERFDWVGTTCFGPDAESRAKGYTYDEVGKK